MAKIDFLKKRVEEFLAGAKFHFKQKGTAKIYKKEKEIEDLLNRNASIIGDLNQAYLTARYLPVEFTKKRIENMFNFTQELINFLEKL